MADRTLVELPTKMTPPETKGGEDVNDTPGAKADSGGDKVEPSALSYLSCATAVLDLTITAALNELNRLKGEDKFIYFWRGEGGGLYQAHPLLLEWVF